jgi:hypothetical protein
MLPSRIIGVAVQFSYLVPDFIGAIIEVPFEDPFPVSIACEHLMLNQKRNMTAQQVIGKTFISVLWMIKDHRKEVSMT